MPRRSTVESFRRRYHPTHVLYLSRRGDDTAQDDLLVITQSGQGFYIGRNVDTMEGAVPFYITVDIAYFAADETMLGKASVADLFDLSTGLYRRFKIDSETQPVAQGERYTFGAHPAYSDTRPYV